METFAKIMLAILVSWDSNLKSVAPISTASYTLHVLNKNLSNNKPFDYQGGPGY